MALDVTPSAWIADWSENGTDVTFPIASIPYLDAVEADGTTGDIRKVMFALIEKIYSTYIETASADRPTKMTLSKSVSTNTETGVITNNYSIRFYTRISDQEVVSEA